MANSDCNCCDAPWSFRIGRDLPDYKSIIKYTDSLDEVWYTTFGFDDNASAAASHDLALDSSGNLWVCGNAVDAAGGNYTVIRKFVSSTGAHAGVDITYQPTGAPGNFDSYIANRLVIDSSDNLYVSGRFNLNATSDVGILRKYDSSQSLSWAVTMAGGTGSSHGSHIALDEQAGELLAMHYDGTSAAYLTFFDVSNGTALSTPSNPTTLSGADGRYEGDSFLLDYTPTAGADDRFWSTQFSSINANHAILWDEYGSTGQALGAGTYNGHAILVDEDDGSTKYVGGPYGIKKYSSDWSTVLWTYEVYSTTPGTQGEVSSMRFDSTKAFIFALESDGITNKTRTVKINSATGAQVESVDFQNSSTSSGVTQLYNLFVDSDDNVYVCGSPTPI